MLSINEGEIEVELPDGGRQKVKTIVGLTVGDFVLTHQNVAIEKIEQADAEAIITEIKALSQRKEGS